MIKVRFYNTSDGFVCALFEIYVNSNSTKFINYSPDLGKGSALKEIFPFRVSD